MGLAIGYVAVQTSSLWPCVLLHAVHNALQIIIHKLAVVVERSPESPLAVLLGGDEPMLYHPVTVALCAAGVLGILAALHRESYRRTAEEQLEEARQRQDSPLVGA
jgi:hypothetical protein